METDDDDAATHYGFADKKIPSIFFKRIIIWIFLNFCKLPFVTSLFQIYTNELKLYFNWIYNKERFVMKATKYTDNLLQHE